MDLPGVIAIGAFVLLGIMFALLWASGRRDEKTDTITQEIIIKANTGPVTVVTHPSPPPASPQEEED